MRWRVLVPHRSPICGFRMRLPPRGSPNRSANSFARSVGRGDDDPLTRPFAQGNFRSPTPEPIAGPVTFLTFPLSMALVQIDENLVRCSTGKSSSFATVTLVAQRNALQAFRQHPGEEGDDLKDCASIRSETAFSVECRVDSKAANGVNRLGHWPAALVDSFRMTSEFMK
jgi:hypothetical protein